MATQAEVVFPEVSQVHNLRGRMEVTDGALGVAGIWSLLFWFCNVSAGFIAKTAGPLLPDAVELIAIPEAIISIVSLSALLNMLSELYALRNRGGSCNFITVSLCEKISPWLASLVTNVGLTLIPLIAGKGAEMVAQDRKYNLLLISLMAVFGTSLTVFLNAKIAAGEVDGLVNTLAPVDRSVRRVTSEVGKAARIAVKSVANSITESADDMERLLVMQADMLGFRYRDNG